MTVAVVWLDTASQGVAASRDPARVGASIYRKQCASCHGAKGEGVPDKYEEPLQGMRSIESLARLIERTMPEDKPGTCTGDDAVAVATYLHGAFYSAEARARLNPVRMELSRLTARQFRESVADLIGGFAPSKHASKPGGLKAEYFQSKGMNKKDRKGFERVDGAVDFDFGEHGPGGDIAADQFSIAWAGSLLAPESGLYEFRLSTPNGARLYLNAELLAGDSNRRDDSDARRQGATIDLWVSSGNEMREGMARQYLLGGRSYPVRVDYFKFKDKQASVRLEWKPPEGTWAVVPADCLSTEPSTRVAVVGTAFPPDDGSQGYERGTTVSRAWQDAVTKASVEAANLIVGRLGSLAGAGEGATNRAEKARAFCATFAERAFRRPLTAEGRRAFVDAAFEGDPAVEIAVKRSVVRVLGSPQFLYPEVEGPVDDHRVAARLALHLWDSVPDATLREAAGKGELRDPERIASAARRMMGDPRARAKLMGFFRHWLRVDEAADISKDAKAYPGFDATVVADLRMSLERFVEETVWSEGSDFRELLLADYLFLNPRLAKFYGVEAPAGDGFGRVTFDAAQRAGILTHPFLLATFSYHRSSSPIHRGVFLTRNVLGRALRPPPMAIEFMDDRFDPSLTMREKVTQLTSKEACMGCHATINPLGFSLEHYDAVGRFRTEDNRKPVDAVSDYRTEEGEVLRLRGPRDVANHAVNSPEARLGFVRQLFQHVVKQSPAAFGPDTLGKLDAGFVRGGHHMRDLVVEIAATAAGQGVVEAR